MTSPAAEAMTREVALRRLQGEVFDVLVVGGGATGLGVALDAATRGYRTGLIERGDFASGTSSRSSKIIHGGLRYLRQGNFRLVAEGLREKARLLRNAPGTVRELDYVLPNYTWWDGLLHGAGVALYGLLAAKSGGVNARWLGSEATKTLLPALNPRELRGAITYRDAQFDDAGLALAIARTAWANGAAIANGVRAEAFAKEGGKICGVEATDIESGERFRIRARVVVNAAGPTADALVQCDHPSPRPMVSPSQGTHIVLDRSFFPGTAALIAPLAREGRVLLIVPWQNAVLIGPTDVAIRDGSAEPQPTFSELEELLASAGRFLRRRPELHDIRSTFAGIRPLVGGSVGSTARASREHTLSTSKSGLVTITGGKWTTYRQMAEETVTLAAQVGGLPSSPCATKDLQLAETRASETSALMSADAALGSPLQSDRSETLADVVHAVRFEMARTIEDVLGRRLRVLFVDARKAREMAPPVARVLASELGRGADWVDAELRRFSAVVDNFLPPVR